jgi:hypothetical protein
LQVETDEFLISRHVLRLSHWQNIVTHPDLGKLDGAIPQRHLEGIAERTTAATTIAVEPTAGEIQAS